MTEQRRKPWILGCLFIAAVALITAAPSALAQRVTVEAGFPECVPATAHSLVTASVAPEGPYTFVRVYFKRHGEKQYYFVEMRAENGAGFWGVLPKPECGTSKVDMYVAVGDASGNVSRTDERTVDVRNDKRCQATLTQEQWEYAQNLVVGETAPEQKDKAVLGFCCDGIVARLESDGVVRPDQICRDQRLAQTQCTCCGAVVAAVPLRRILPWIGVGAVAGGGVVAINEDPKPECSPCRP